MYLRPLLIEMPSEAWIRSTSLLNFPGTAAAEFKTKDCGVCKPSAAYLSKRLHAALGLSGFSPISVFLDEIRAGL